MKKVVFITNIPAHYRVAMLNTAYRFLKENDIELIVVFSRITYRRRGYWNVSTKDFLFRHYVLGNKSSINIGKTKLIELGTGLKKILSEINPDIIISGGFSISSLTAERFASKNYIPIIIYSGETKMTASQLRLKYIRNILRKHLIKRAAHFIVYGTKAKEYIESFSVPEEQITIAINSIDTDKFTSIINSVKTDFNRNKVNLLFVGDLMKHKGLLHLIKALQLATNSNFLLTAIGGGTEEKYIKRYIFKNKIEFVNLTGKVNHEDIHKYYSAADIFIMPSTFEPFGLVLVEAACAGLPLLGTKYAGASYDIIEEGENGYIINPINYLEFSEKLNILIENKELRDKMGNASREVINRKVNIHLSGKGFADGVMKGLSA